MLVRFRTTHPDFYASFLNDRKVIEYDTRYETQGANPNRPVTLASADL